ncbi:MAG: hypothetical protein J0I70_04485 [Microbacterium sp.]|uniref:COG4705 family protein n=1 Tax=Microbacterium sp. TaxID=51671 RepID=UPI001AC3601E|nr:hypothetical protein [Microbacterium sp.]MBN9155768.1 hypothetical protein [Microbacterium sp.]MBN9171626.1 hypothetical protein [Microbacterium sp.]MBN9173396.1 hypothetical protein [Microbacterium sp.]
MTRALTTRRAGRMPAAAARVPDPTASFWVTKAASTALGEAVSDFSIRVLPPVLAVLLGFALFVAALAFQLTRRRYIPEVYWLTVAAVGIFGTMAADVVHVVIGLPYAVSSTLYALVLAVVFVTWWRVERTLSVHAVTTTRREVFYWAAVVGTFALGTAVGDFTAVGLGLGYLPSIALFAVLILVPALGYRFLRFNAVFAFWFAYVLTRPLGASVADWLGKPVPEGGVGLGSGWVSLAFAVVMVALVATMRIRARAPRASGASEA